jgi:nicotinamidase-related amidase
MTQALVIMDVQNGIVDRFDAPEAYLDRVVAAQERAEQAGLPVVLVRVGFAPGHPEVSRRNKTFSALAADPAMVLGDRAVEPHERLLRGKGEVVVTKKRVSAFAGSDLELVLRAQDVTAPGARRDRDQRGGAVDGPGRGRPGLPADRAGRPVP